jgi:SsrA-binding protein
VAILLTNKKARFDYHILETFQAGLSLSGPMVKWIRGNKVQLVGVFVVYQKGNLEMINFGNDILRENVGLLLKQREVEDIRGQLATKGISCVPLNIKTVGRWLKADIAIVKGKKNYDKRETIKQRDLDREEVRGLN